MEVHSHAHTERKKFTHYLWEFFMLFLAVTLGFFVENSREHYIEHQREKKFVELLYNDLKLDTARINFIRRVKTWKGSKIDSLRSLLASSDLQQHAAFAYYYSFFINFNQKFYAQDATMQQLQNSGSLRFFKNHELYVSIIQYYKTCTFFLDREVESENQFAYPGELISKIFDSKILMGKFDVTNDLPNTVHIPGGNPQLLSADKRLINEYYLFISNKKFVNDVALYFLGITENNAKKLIGLIKEEYHLK